MKTCKLEIVELETMPRIKEEGILYISEKFELSIHLCACGCGQETVLPFDKETGWVLTRNPDHTVTIRPSIGQRMPCKSHYYITDSAIEWLSPMP